MSSETITHDKNVFTRAVICNIYVANGAILILTRFSDTCQVQFICMQMKGMTHMHSHLAGYTHYNQGYPCGCKVINFIDI